MDTFSDSPVPTSRSVNRFRETGSVKYRNRCGRQSALSDDGLDDIHQILLRFARKPLRKLVLQSDLCYGSLDKAPKFLKFEAYRVHVMRKLRNPEKERRL
jgi:hypothetical protein